MSRCRPRWPQHSPPHDEPQPPQPPQLVPVDTTAGAAGAAAGAGSAPASAAEVSIKKATFTIKPPYMGYRRHGSVAAGAGIRLCKRITGPLPFPLSSDLPSPRLPSQKRVGPKFCHLSSSARIPAFSNLTWNPPFLKIPQLQNLAILTLLSLFLGQGTAQRRNFLPFGKLMRVDANSLFSDVLRWEFEQRKLARA